MMTGGLNGSVTAPIAVRARCPTSVPKRATTSSEHGFITSGCSREHCVDVDVSTYRRPHRHPIEVAEGGPETRIRRRLIRTQANGILTPGGTTGAGGAPIRVCGLLLNVHFRSFRTTPAQVAEDAQRPPQLAKFLDTGWPDFLTRHGR
jgi:hypothetical protein